MPDRKVAVLIPTYKRAAGLTQLLAALPPAATVDGVTIDVVVADNDPDGTAADVVERAAPGFPWPVRYIRQPVPGISHTRNALLDATSDHDFAAFVDDDEIPEPGWLSKLIAVADRFNADVVVGPQVYEFAGDVSKLVASAPCFANIRRPTGSDVRWPSTANVLLRMTRVRGTGIRFREQYSLAGGGDTMFFEELRNAGVPAVWADDALVIERVPPSRATLSFVARRGLRIGNATASVERDLGWSGSQRVVRVVKALGWVLTGSARIFAGVLLLRRSMVSAGLYHAARGIGMLGVFVNYRVVGYRRQPPQT